MNACERSRFTYVVATVLAIFLRADTTPAPAPTVVAVHDGDTLRLSTGESVRLVGIDAPELAQPGPWGAVATRWLAAHTRGEPIRVVPEPDAHDPYGRVLAEVYTDLDGSLNLALVREGLAYAYTPTGRRHPARWKEIVAAEGFAKAAGKGVWSDPKAQRPWEWRAARRHPGPTPAGRGLIEDIFGKRPRPVPAPTPTPSPQSPAAVPSEAEIVALHNARRAAYRLAPLATDARLTAAARVQAEDCARRGKMGHVGSDGSWPWDRITRQGYTYAACAENAGRMPRGPLRDDGSPYFPITAARMMDGWMSSSGHRANILGPYSQAGAAVAVAGNGDAYFIVDFGRP